MNITGTLLDIQAASNNSTGAFSITGKSGHGFQLTTASNHDINFDASKAWTGETSAVGGGASHTHGIKNIAKIKKYDKIKLRNTSLKVNLGLVPFLGCSRYQNPLVEK